MLVGIPRWIEHIKIPFVIAGIFFHAPCSQAIPSNQKDSNIMDSIFLKTKPQCIGRYLIDVPATFDNQLKNMIFIDDFKISSKPQYRPPFEQLILRREIELKNSSDKPANKPEYAPYLKQVIKLKNNSGVIFDHNMPGTPDTYRQLEGYIFLNGITFIITTNIRDFSGEKNQKKKTSILHEGLLKQSQIINPRD
jgi:hypothetical protein